ncbi:MAG TPA: hypothetical protein VGN13_05585 [Solirubrobacteraceae bacterium]
MKTAEQIYRDALEAIATFSVPGVSGGTDNNAQTLAEFAQSSLRQGAAAAYVPRSEAVERDESTEEHQ